MAAALCLVTLLAVCGGINGARITDVAELFNWEGASFDWTKGSCDVDALTADDLATAVDAKKSGAGNMGGVYFMTLSRPNCNVVVKPRIDLHDAYASALGQTLGAPVAKTRLLTPEATPDEWKSLLASFEALDPFEKKAFLTYVAEGSGFVQIMAVAEGKDLYSLTDETLGWEACHECLGQEVREKIRKGLGAGDDSEILEKLAAMMHKRLNMDTRVICKKVWEYVSADSDKVAKFWPDKPQPPKWCPTAYRKSEEFATDLRKYYEVNNASVDEELGKAFANRPQRTMDVFCPISKKPMPADVDTAKNYTRWVLNSSATLADAAKLSAFISLICENDNFNAMGYTSSNYHNVFFSPRHVTGIDMAVGGALDHGKIKPGAEPSELLNKAGGIAFMYPDIEKAARVGTCGSDEEVKALARTYAGKMTRPYVGDREGNYQQCAKDKGLTGPLSEMIGHGVEIVKAWPAAMKSIIEGADEAIVTVREEFTGLNDPLAGAIKTFLDFHFSKLKEAYDKGIEACD